MGNSHPNIFTGYAFGPKVTVVSIQIQIRMLLFVTVIKHLYSATQWIRGAPDLSEWQIKLN